MCRSRMKKGAILACAIEAGCACFITTDNGILRKRAQIPEIQILNPVAFAKRPARIPSP